MTSTTKTKLVLVGEFLINKNSDKTVEIWVNPNNVTHVKSAICPVMPFEDAASWANEPEDYLEIGTFIFVTKPDTAVQSMIGSITMGPNPQAIFTNLHIKDVIKILNGDITYEDITEDRIIGLPDVDIRNRLGQVL